MFDNSIDAFKQMSTPQSHNAIIALQPIIERFIVIPYDRTCASETVNAARKELFTQKGRQIDHIPPTSSALTEHFKRAVLQAGYIWGQATEAKQVIPS
jgi:hypothetical protein